MQVLKCRKIKSELYDYHQNKLSLTERQEIETHLISCERCREELESLRKVLNTIEQGDPPELSPTFTQKVLQKITTAKQHKYQFNYKLTHLIGFLTRKWSYAGIIVLLICSFFLGRIYQGSIIRHKLVFSQPRGLESPLLISQKTLPITIEIEKGQFYESFVKMLSIINKHNGRLLSLRLINSSIEMVIQVKQVEKPLIISELKKIGQVQSDKIEYSSAQAEEIIIIFLQVK